MFDALPSFVAARRVHECACLALFALFFLVGYRGGEGRGEERKEGLLFMLLLARDHRLHEPIRLIAVAHTDFSRLLRLCLWSVVIRFGERLEPRAARVNSRVG